MTVPDKNFSKMGQQLNADDPFTFTMSTPDIDSYGDNVVQNWDLKQFKKNPIALWGHNNSALPIGTWENVRKIGGNLTGKLRLAKQGTSEFIDSLRSLVEQGILKAVSVGFVSHKQEPIDKEKPWDGYRLDENKLLECSLVNIGAADGALIQATKSMNLTKETQDILSASMTIETCSASPLKIATNKNQIEILKRNLT